LYTLLFLYPGALFFRNKYEDGWRFAGRRHNTATANAARENVNE